MARLARLTAQPDAELMQDEEEQNSIAKLGEVRGFQLSFLPAKYKTPH